jgi:hypothetical protein
MWDGRFVVARIYVGAYVPRWEFFFFPKWMDGFGAGVMDRMVWKSSFSMCSLEVNQHP